MARPRKIDINSPNRREDLIVAAARLFQEKCFHGTTMRDIAAATNMRAGSPFYHFASKQDLLYAGVHQGMLVCLQALEAIDAKQMPALDYFRCLARAHLAYLLEDHAAIAPLVEDAWQHLEGDQREAVIQLRRRYETLWLSAFRAMEHAGLVRRADKRACWFFLGSLHSIGGWYAPGGKLTIEQIADDLVDWAICPKSEIGRPLRRTSLASRHSN